MAIRLDRLRAGKATWGDHTAIRLCGVVILTGFPGVIDALVCARRCPPLPLTDVQVLLIAMFGVLCLVTGLNLLFVGPSLFEEHPWPGRFGRDLARPTRTD